MECAGSLARISLNIERKNLQFPSRSRRSPNYLGEASGFLKLKIKNAS